MVNLKLGSHVDALRGVIKNEHIGVRLQPASQNHLLLVAARKGGNGILGIAGFDLHGGLLALKAFPFLAGADQQRFHPCVEKAHGGVVVNAQVV